MLAIPSGYAQHASLQPNPFSTPSSYTILSGGSLHPGFPVAGNGMLHAPSAYLFSGQPFYQQNAMPGPPPASLILSSVAYQQPNGGPVVHAQPPPAQQAPFANTIFGCDFRCGFSGSFFQVQAHEAVCQWNPRGVRAPLVNFVRQPMQYFMGSGQFVSQPTLLPQPTPLPILSGRGSVALVPRKPNERKVTDVPLDQSEGMYKSSPALIQTKPKNSPALIKPPARSTTDGPALIRSSDVDKTSKLGSIDATTKQKVTESAQIVNIASLQVDTPLFVNQPPPPPPPLSTAKPEPQEQQAPGIAKPPMPATAGEDQISQPVPAASTQEQAPADSAKGSRDSSRGAETSSQPAALGFEAAADATTKERQRERDEQENVQRAVTDTAQGTAAAESEGGEGAGKATHKRPLDEVELSTETASKKLPRNDDAAKEKQAEREKVKVKEEEEEEEEEGVEEQEGGVSAEERRTLVVMRHGQRMDEVDPSWGATAERPYDPPLTAHGAAQAVERGQLLALSGWTPDVVVCSPFLRCVQDVLEGDARAKLTRKRLAVDFGLSEWHSARNMHNRSPVYRTVQELQKEEDAELTGRLHRWLGSTDESAGQGPPPCPESQEACSDRYTATFARLLARFPRGNILAVSHGDAVAQFLACTMKIAKDTVYQVQHCSYVKGQASGCTSGRPKWEFEDKDEELAVVKKLVQQPSQEQRSQRDQRMDRKSKLVEIAAQTCQIISTGLYVAADGSSVDISAEVNSACSGSTNYNSFADLRARSVVKTDSERPYGSVTVTAESTIDCVMRMRRMEGDAPRISVLNFASAKNPGGGFQNGAAAQEESLARASALYGCLTKHLDRYYKENRQTHDGIYTDNIIWSPAVPIFRAGRDGSLCSHPCEASFITLPAVNAGVVAQNKNLRSGQVAAIVEENMRRRIQMVFYMAAAQGTDILVLGAFGCGCFRNSASDVARWFKEELERANGAWLRHFQQVVFAIYDPSKTQQTMRSFMEVLGAFDATKPDRAETRSTQDTTSQPSGPKPPGPVRKDGAGNVPADTAHRSNADDDLTS